MRYGSPTIPRQNSSAGGSPGINLVTLDSWLQLNGSRLLALEEQIPNGSL